MENTFHRYLNLPFEIEKPEILKFTDRYEHFEMKTYCNVQMIELLATLDLEMSAIEAFHTPPGDKIDIHCDSAEIDNHVKINVTWGPEEGTTRWWDCKKMQPIFRQHIVTDISGNTEKRKPEGLVAFEENCNLVYEASTNTPSLVNVGKMHSTYNPNKTEGRWTLCFVLKHKYSESPYVHWDDALKIFSEFIEGES